LEFKSGTEQVINPRKNYPKIWDLAAENRLNSILNSKIELGFAAEFDSWLD